MGDTVIAMGCSSCGGKAARFRGSQAQVRARKQACCCCTAAERLLRDLEVIVGQHVFVDPVHGNDTTGSRERLDRPFLTISAALAAAHSGDTISLQPGQYSITSSIVFPENDALGNPLSTLVVESWGGSENVLLFNATGLPIFRISGTAPANTYDNLTFRGLTVLSFNTQLSPQPAFVFGSTTADQFSGANLNSLGLVFDDVFTTGFTLTRLGHVKATDVVSNGLTILGCSDVQFNDSILSNLYAVYASAGATPTDYTTALGRLGYRFSNVQITNATLEGALSAAFDSSCRVFQISASIPPYLATTALPALNPSVRFAGTIGGVGNHNETNIPNTDLPNASIFNFGNVAWQQQVTSDLSGVDLSGTRAYASVIFTFGFALTAQLDSNDFFFGGDNASFLADLTVRDTNATPADPPYYTRFRNCAFGTGKFATNGPPSSTITADNATIDMRGSSLADADADVELNVLPVGVSDGYQNGIDRDRAYIRRVSLAAGDDTFVENISPATSLAPARFPDYAASGIFPIMTLTDGSFLVVTSATANNEQVTGTVGAHPANTVSFDLMVVRDASGGSTNLLANLHVLSVRPALHEARGACAFCRTTSRFMG